MINIQDAFHGTFVIEPETIQLKLFKAKAYVFDWDGVFNNGMKDREGSSSFSEVDAMGTNLLRFCHYLQHEQAPVSGIISGEKNDRSFAFARRESFHAVYYGMKSKKESLQHICSTHNIRPEEVVFFFDDVLDLSVAELCGLRIMVGRECNPLLAQYAVDHNMVDYITNADGGNHALREAAELLLALSGRYEDVLSGRIQFSGAYQHYLAARSLNKLVFYTAIDGQITERDPQ